MHAAASIAASAAVFGHRNGVGIGRAARVDGDETAGLDDAVERAAVDDQVFDERKRLGAPGLDGDRLAVLEMAHVQLAGGGAAFVRRAELPLMTSEHMPQMPSRQSRSKAIGSSPSADQSLVDHVEHFEERHVRHDVARPRRSRNRPGEAAFFCRQTLSVRFICSSVCSCGLLRRPAVPCADYGRLVRPLVFPRRHIGKILVVALGFAVRRLVFLAEMAAAGFVADAARPGRAVRQIP